MSSPLAEAPPPIDQDGCDGTLGNLLCSGAKALTSSQLIFSLLVYTGGGGFFLIAFCILWPHLIIYTTRIHFANVTIKPPPIFVDGSSVRNWLYRLVAWIVPVLYTDKHAFIRTCGLDGYILSRIMVLMVEIFLPITIWVCAIILPVNLQGNVSKEGNQRANGIVDDFTKFTMGNIENGSLLFIVHFISAYAIVVWTTFCTSRFWRHFADIRIQYLIIMTNTRRKNAKSTPVTDDFIQYLPSDGSEDQKYGGGGDVDRAMFTMNETEQQRMGYFHQSLMKYFTTINVSKYWNKKHARRTKRNFGTKKLNVEMSDTEDSSDMIRPRIRERFDLSQNCSEDYVAPNVVNSMRKKAPATETIELPETKLFSCRDNNSSRSTKSDDIYTHNRKTTKSEISGTELFNDDIIVSNDDLLVDISNYAILVQDVTLRQRSDWSKQGEEKPNKRHDNWVQRYTNSWSFNLMRSRRGSKGIAPSPRPSSDRTLFDIESITKRIENANSSHCESRDRADVDANKENLEATTRKVFGKSNHKETAFLRRRLNSSRVLSNISSSDSIESNTSTDFSSAREYYNKCDDAVVGGDQNDDVNSSDMTFGNTKLISLLKTVRRRFELCFPNSVHVVIPVIKHKSVDNLLLQLDIEIEKLERLRACEQLGSDPQTTGGRKSAGGRFRGDKSVPSFTDLSESHVQTLSIEKVVASSDYANPTNRALPEDMHSAIVPDSNNYKSSQKIPLASIAANDIDENRCACCYCCRDTKIKEKICIARIAALKEQILKERVNTLQGYDLVPSSFIVIFKVEDYSVSLAIINFYVYIFLCRCCRFLQPQ